MNTDKAPANSVALGYTGGGDAGRGRVEHRSFRHVEVTQSVRNSLSGMIFTTNYSKSRTIPSYARSSLTSVDNDCTSLLDSVAFP